jgi:hypothetical protein
LRASAIRDQPWKELPTTTEDVEALEDWMKRARRFEYNPDEDVANNLLAEARKGNGVAMSKLEFYIQQFKPNWSHRFELKKMLAVRRGISGIATFYSETRRARALKGERRSIELAMRQIENEAEQGSLIDAVVLYQFCGSLAETQHELPANSNLSASAKALELIATYSGIKVMRNVAAFEAVRLGFAQNEFLSGNYYPHTPRGWTPSHTVKGNKGTDDMKARSW